MLPATKRLKNENQISGKKHLHSSWSQGEGLAWVWVWAPGFPRMAFWTLFKPVHRFFAASVHSGLAPTPSPLRGVTVHPDRSQNCVGGSQSLCPCPRFLLCFLSFGGGVVRPEPCVHLLGNGIYPPLLSPVVSTCLCRKGQGGIRLTFCLRVWERMLSREAAFFCQPTYTSSQQPSGDFCLLSGLLLLMVGVSNALRRELGSVPSWRGPCFWSSQVLLHRTSQS